MAGRRSKSNVDPKDIVAPVPPVPETPYEKGDIWAEEETSTFEDMDVESIEMLREEEDDDFDESYD